MFLLGNSVSDVMTGKSLAATIHGTVLNSTVITIIVYQASPSMGFPCDMMGLELAPSTLVNAWSYAQLERNTAKDFDCVVHEAQCVWHNRYEPDIAGDTNSLSFNKGRCDLLGQSEGKINSVNNEVQPMTVSVTCLSPKSLLRLLCDT